MRDVRTFVGIFFLISCRLILHHDSVVELASYALQFDKFFRLSHCVTNFSNLLAWKGIMSFHRYKIPYGEPTAWADVERQKRRDFFLGFILSYMMGATSRPLTHHWKFVRKNDAILLSQVSDEMNTVQTKWFDAKWMFSVVRSCIAQIHFFQASNYRVLFTCVSIFIRGKFVSVQIQQLPFLSHGQVRHGDRPQGVWTNHRL